MTFIPAIVLLAILVWGFEIRPKITGGGGDGLTPNAASLVSGLVNDFWVPGSLGDPNRPLYQKYRNDRRTAISLMRQHLDRDPKLVIRDPLAKDGTSPAKYYSDRAESSYLGHEYAVMNRKLDANLEGTRVPMGTTSTAVATTTAWTRMLNEEGRPIQLFAGDIICASGQVANRMLTENGQIIWFGPEGAPHVRTIDGFTAKYERFPMLSFLGRVDGNENKVFVIGTGCTPAKFSGQNFEISVNVPYTDEHGFMATGMATNKDLGSFTVTRIEHK